MRVRGQWMPLVFFGYGVISGLGLGLCYIRYGYHP